MSKDTGGLAFPVTEQNGANYGDCGMTLRDYFAAKAMQGFCANQSHYVLDGSQEFEAVATEAYAMADAMLKAREQ